MTLMNEVKELVSKPISANVICRELELRPQYLSMYIASIAHMPFEYGYILIGVGKRTDKYLVNGISLNFKVKEAVDKALQLLSEMPQIEQGIVRLEEGNIFAIKVYAVTKSIYLKNVQGSDSSTDRFIKNLIIACSKLQQRKIWSDKIEDVRNDQIVDLLSSLLLPSGYVVNDQSRRGVSSTGKASGEVDMLVENEGLPFAIIEALNLNSVDKTKLGKHLDKIYSYDTTGTAINVCLSYVNVGDFGNFWNKYCTYAKEHTYPALLVSSDENADKDYGFTEIRFMTTTHERSGKPTILYHICVKMQTR